MIKYALIVAGGSGNRMQSTTPKQFLVIDGMPILMHTIKAFYQFDSGLNIILVLPENQLESWQYLIKNNHFTIKHQVIAGGLTRYDSVKNGLAAIHDRGLVAIHDGVRPLVTPQIIGRTFEAAAAYGSGVAAIKPKDSIRLLEDNTNRNLNREALRLIQTPQTFTTDIIKQAYTTYNDLGFTDDASVAEYAGHKINLVDGDYKNIKITTPEDLKIAQALLENLK